MDMMKTASMLARYSAWANERIYEGVTGLPPGEAEKPRPGLFRNMVHMLNHNYVIDDIFKAHMEGRIHGYTARNTQDHPPLATLHEQQRAMDAWYQHWVADQTEATLDEKVHFTFVGGGDGVMTRGQILLHIVNHTTYHRGFVAQMMYDTGARPPTNDLTIFLRDVPQPG